MFTTKKELFSFLISLAFVIGVAPAVAAKGCAHNFVRKAAENESGWIGVFA